MFSMLGARARRLGGALRSLVVVAFLWLAPAFAAHAALTVTPLTWDIIGLDSNRPADGPRHFPVGARVCSNVATTNVEVDFVWDSANAAIELRPGSLSSITFPAIGAGECVDAYFEVEVAANASSFDTVRRYRIVAEDSTGTYSTPTPRQLYVERLVSQSRNAITNLRYGPDADNLVAVGPGGGLDLIVGETYVIELTGSTATQGYEQLEAFINFTNTIFRITDVVTTYSADTSPIVPSPNDRLYGDACGWENDPNSPNYRSCLGTGKVGGSITTLYTITIIGGGGTSQTLNTLVHDFSGSSYHYNADFGTGARIANIIDPNASGIAKAFTPSTAPVNGVSALTITLTNPNGGALTGYSFVDNLPANMQIAATPAVTTAGCGTPTVSAPAGGTTISFSNGSVAANGTCTIKVNVTATATGSLLNTTGNLFVEGIDTGKTASATLVVNNEPPPGTGLCGQELARWTFPTGFNVNAPAPTSATVAASAAPGAGIVPNTQTNIANPVVAPAPDSTIAWGSNGSINVDPTLTTANDEYFQFAVDTTGVSSVQFTFDARRTNNGPRGIALYYGTTNTRPETGTLVFSNATALPTTTAVSFSSGQITTGLNPAGPTFFRVYYFDSNNDNPGADPTIDNVLVTSCGEGIKPTISKAFAPDPIGVGGTSTLTFTLANTNAAQLTGAAFTDTLPAGVQVATTPAAASTCGGTWTPAAGSTNLTFSGGTIPANGTCTVSVAVTATTAGPKTNISGFLSTVETGTTTTSVATATLTALAPPAIAKQFAPNPILVNGVSTLTFTIENPNPDHAISSVAFSDAFPAAPAQMVVAASPNATTSGCGAPTFAPVAGATSVSFSGGTIAAGGTCVVTVAVTASAAGAYVNTTGSVSHDVAGTTFNGNTASDTLDVTQPNPAISLLKQVATSATGPWLSFQAVNLPANVFYRFTIENTGDVPLSAIAVNDALVSAAGCTWPASLPVADAFDDDHIATCVVGPVAASAGNVVNTATAEGTFSGNTVEDVDSAAYANAALSIDKSATPSTYTAAGDVIAYSFLVTNTGAATLSGPITVLDDRTTNESCPALTTVGDLDAFFDPGESITCSATYTITAGDVAATSVTNTASATNGSTTSPPDSATVDLVGPRLTLIKSAAPTPFVAGQPASYTITVTNDGTAATTANVVVTDALPAGVTRVSDSGTGWSCTGTTNLTCTFTGTLQAAPAAGSSTVLTINVAVAAGTVDATNTATASGGGDPTCPADASCSDTVVVGAVTPALVTSKALTSNADGDGSGSVTQGDVLTYTVTVTNTGSVALTGVVVADPMLTPTGGTTPCASVAIGATCTLVGTYTVTAADVTTGSITNTGTGDSNETPPDDDTLVTPVQGSPALSTAKALTSNADGDGSGTVTQGDVLTYTVTATNTGNVPLTNVVVSDPMLNASGGTTPCASVAVGATCTLVGTYTVTAADVTAGSITNTGTGDSDQTPPDGDTLVTPVAGTPGLTASKSLTSNADNDGSGSITQGDVLTYTITATNTGNVPLTNVVVTDSLITPTGGTTPCATLAVGATCTLVGTYVVTAGDISTGTITNTGTVDSDETPPDDDTLVTPVIGSPALATAKALTSNADGDGSGTVTQGDVLTYTITVTNTGDIDLTGVVVSDPLLTPTGGTTPCATVVPTATCTLVGTYTVGFGDVAAGSITNTGTGDSNETGPDSDTLVTPVAGSPALSTSKSLTSNADGDGSGSITQGDVLTYTITVTNTGNVALTNVVVTDTRVTPTGGTTPCASVAVGGTCTLVGTYTVTGADVTAGSITNTGTGDSNETPPDDDTLVTPVGGSPSLAVSKALTSNADNDGSGSITQGDVLTYTITAANTGNVPLTNVVVSDPRVTPTGGTTPCASVAVGASCTLVGTYTVTGADVTAGSITNTGSADSNETPPDDDTLVTPVAGSPRLTVSKVLTSNADNDGSGSVTPGDVLTYTVTAANTGNVAIANVVVSDTRIVRTGGNSPCASLAIGATCTLVGTYTVTAGDAASGSIVNTGSAAADGVCNPTSAGSVCSDTETTPVSGVPDLTVDKSHVGDFTQGQVGAQFTIVVRNIGTGATSGTVTLSDALPAGLTATAFSGTGWSCTLSPLACTRADALAGGTSYPVLVLTVNVASNAGSPLVNTATVSGGGDASPGNNTDSDPVVVAEAGLPLAPDLQLVKSRSGTFLRGESGGRYTLAVSNVGTGSTAGTVTVVDTMPAGLTATSISGTGWTCTLATMTCTRGDALAAGAAYPAITIEVTVAANAPDQPVNVASVSGGGDTTPPNNSDSEPTPVGNAQPAVPVPGGAPWALVLLALALLMVGVRRTSRLR